MREVKRTYRVEGFSCANCAGKFERNVKALPGVVDAKVNFGASKITVVGQASVEELEKAGAFENLKIYPERRRQGKERTGDRKEKQASFFEKHQTLLYSGLFLVLGALSIYINGEDNLVTVLLFISSIAIGGFPLLKTGLSNLIHLDFDMRTLMTIAIIGATIIGEWAEAAVVVILFAISEALERYSMDKARKSIQSLMEIAPNEALIFRDGKEVAVPVEEVEIGDVMIVKPGQKIAMDGVVVKGASSVNEAAITGESIPASKQPGDEVFAGTLNEEGHLEVRVTKYAEDTMISKIIELVEEAQAERAPAQAFVDKFAKYYTPAIIMIAFLTAVVPPLFFDGVWLDWIYQGLSVLVVGCPCALVISTPISIVSAIGSAAKKGVLIKGGAYLEELGSIKAIAFDKTGTLTKGEPAITDFVMYTDRLTEKEALAVACALEKMSNHPLARAFEKKAGELGVEVSKEDVGDFSSITGKGIQGKIGETTYYIGSPLLFIDLSVDFSEEVKRKAAELQNEGKTVMLFGTQEKVYAIFAVLDEVRGSTKNVLQKLHEMGIQKTVMLTGDHSKTAAAVGKAVGISEVKAELMPEEKLEQIKQLRNDFGKVAMVGDGVNDAPALAAATVGIAMGGAGTDTALETADVALMADDLGKLPYTIRLSRKTLAVIKTNIAFALGVKLLALLLVVPGWLTLWIAVFSDMGATLLVTLNSMRLLSVKE
ncbi:heavy metal translocating P-type ATPase [Ureibacillus sp. FSL K6-8385]|uniref:Cd(2+)-exporting ATPase n=1 Tax=Ureibacillus terrenus TaxID=118246 RepID=A0A540V5D8_9BACL|nr:heavy metal translocating P-type ATPase [Ureibacillus terrenus]MED3661160.1 heavy metal translocating P-type ATPase [Ureibacillus terrenus]MED3764363.1 heavy metal translocating P-type ATPase [Ureibacillus terrenus]TQE91961.1 cadmium-translocating P-type ATPase [Ureibacillus terrenus]